MVLYCTIRYSQKCIRRDIPIIIKYKINNYLSQSEREFLLSICEGHQWNPHHTTTAMRWDDWQPCMRRHALPWQDMPCHEMTWVIAQSNSIVQKCLQTGWEHLILKRFFLWKPLYYFPFNAFWLCRSNLILLHQATFTNILQMLLKGC